MNKGYMTFSIVATTVALGASVFWIVEFAAELIKEAREEKKRRNENCNS